MPLRAALILSLSALCLLAQVPKKILFDHTGYQDAGTSAYWLIDTHEPDPVPAHPVAETSWNGGISSWGFDLYKKGYVVQTLPATGRITFGDSTNAQDLANYAAFIIPERYKRFTVAEKQAIVAFVQAGGGLFLQGNHIGAARATSRDPNSTDAYTVFNDLLATHGSGFGFTFVAGHGSGDANANTLTSAVTAATGSIEDALVRGPNGSLVSMDFHSYSYLNLTGSNPSARPILGTQVAGDPSTASFIVAAPYGSGRVVAISDSAPADDGTTTTTGKKLYISWTLYSNRAFHLNASDWLAGGAPAANTVAASITAPASNLTVASGTLVAFAGSATDSSPTATLSYAWNFGDGGTATGAGASHAFTNTGASAVTRTVTFTATDDTGASGSATRTITVNPASGTELLTNGGFESGATGWSGSTAQIGTWTAEPARTGVKDVWLCGKGTTTTHTLYQQLTIPASATRATLSFWLHVDTAETTSTTAYDTLLVRMLNSSGNVLQTLATYSNLHAAAGFQQRSFDVTALKGQTVRIHFKGVEDSTLKTSFVVDDVSLTVQ
ncbi:MAG: PKD domain-containing protein [Acidobacteria bacterium]|nr:PKD domain-containing protein [Acidobacteriota bacterium]